jgi:hypothetical protein
MRFSGEKYNSTVNVHKNVTWKKLSADGEKTKKQEVSGLHLAPLRPD